VRVRPIRDVLLVANAEPDALSVSGPLITVARVTDLGARDQS